jgi:DNA-binding NarL/FixJ family response regulator
MGAELIPVAVIEDHPLYRRGLMQTIERAESLVLAAAAPCLAEMEALNYGDARVVVLDLHLPDGSGAAAVTRVCGRVSAILVVSASDSREDVVEAIGAGANGYLTKSSEADEIVHAIEIVGSGNTYVSPTLASYLLQDNRGRSDTEGLSLTKRELEVLSLLAQGETDADIAARMFISIRTVQSHLDRIRDKTGRRRRADLTRLAFERGAFNRSAQQ